MSIPVTGGSAKRVMDGVVDGPGSLKWAGFIRNPAVSPSGRYIAIATDLPDPTRSDVVIKFWDTRRDRLVDPGLARSCRSVTRTPSGGRAPPTSSPTSAATATARRARPGCTCTT